MPSRLKRIKNAFNLTRMHRWERTKVNIPKVMDVEMEWIGKMLEQRKSEKEIVKYFKGKGMSPTYTRMLIKKLKEKKA